MVSKAEQDIRIANQKFEFQRYLKRAEYKKEMGKMFKRQDTKDKQTQKRENISRIPNNKVKK